MWKLLSKPPFFTPDYNLCRHPPHRLSQTLVRTAPYVDLRALPVPFTVGRPRVDALLGSLRQRCRSVLESAASPPVGGSGSGARGSGSGSGSGIAGPPPLHAYVAACGPAALVDEAAEASHQFGFKFHSEVFAY